MSLLKFNIRRYTYLFLGWGFYSILLILVFTIIFGSIEPNDSYILTFVGCIAMYSLLLLLCAGIENMFGDDVYTFLYVPILNSKILKTIYHIDLGYFIIGINTKESEYGGVAFNIDGYNQSFLYKRRLFSEINVVDISEKEISITVKHMLNHIFRNRINEEKQREIIRKAYKYNKGIIDDAKDKLKKWDGFLDKESRRDGKIDRLLK